MQVKIDGLEPRSFSIKFSGDWKNFDKMRDFIEDELKDFHHETVVIRIPEKLRNLLLKRIQELEEEFEVVCYYNLKKDCVNVGSNTNDDLGAVKSEILAISHQDHKKKVRWSKEVTSKSVDKQEVEDSLEEFNHVTFEWIEDGLFLYALYESDLIEAGEAVKSLFDASDVKVKFVARDAKFNPFLRIKMEELGASTRIKWNQKGCFVLGTANEVKETIQTLRSLEKKCSTRIVGTYKPIPEKTLQRFLCRSEVNEIQQELGVLFIAQTKAKNRLETQVAVVGPKK